MAAECEPAIPGFWRLLAEGRGLLELPRLLLARRALGREPRGDGGPALLLPGIGAGDAWMTPLRRYLLRQGHDARPWGLGRNSGRVPRLVERFSQVVAGVARETGRRAALVGWSLGGVIARETARRHPDLVAGVITFGTPVVGGPKYTRAANHYRRRGFDLDEIEAEVERANRQPIQVPVTAIYSRADGVVAWRACLDPYDNRVEHVEVRSGHLGMVLSPAVFRIVARRLAQPGTRAVVRFLGRVEGASSISRSC